MSRVAGIGGSLAGLHGRDRATTRTIGDQGTQNAANARTDHHLSAGALAEGRTVVVAEKEMHGSGLGPGNAERLERIAGIKDGVALGLEHIDRYREDFGLVIYDQDGFH